MTKPEATLEQVQQQREFVYIFLSEMESLHRAIRQLHDGGFIKQPLPEEAKIFAEESLESLLDDSCVYNTEGHKIYGNPAVIDSINTVLMNRPTREAVRSELISLSPENLLSVINAKTETNMPEGIALDCCGQETEINPKLDV